MEYFIIENGKQTGPFSAQELIDNKHITSETLVWANGLADWTPAWKVEELKALLDAAKAQSEQYQKSAVVPPPVPPVEPQQSYVTEAPKKNNTPKLIAAVVVAALFIAMMVTNPSKEDHKEAIKGVLTELIDKANNEQSADDDFMKMGMNMIAQFFAGPVVENALNSMLDVHNYLIFSRGEVNIGGKSHTVSYGFMGHVYTLNADDVRKAFKMVESKSETKEESTSVTDMDADDNADDNSDIDDFTDKVTKKVTKKVTDKVNEKIDEKLNEAADSTEGFVNKIIKIFGL
jgi:hypothetical protein